MNRTRLQPLFIRRLLPLLAAFVILAGLLALDLAYHGLAWQFFWSQTGEEEPIAQIRGMVEWLGNAIRLQPRTAPLTPIQHTDVNPYGINTFLQKEVEEPKMRVQLQMIASAGFHWLRQEFPWEDLEVDGRGQFTDTRNDYDGDGQPDTIDAWIKYDRLVDLVEEYGLELQVRLSNPPDWSRSNPESGDLAPPDDLQDFVNYAAAVAERYKGRIHYYQVWNEPNGNEEWGRDREVNPEAYTEMLCRTYDALKAVDPQIVVISAALTPTVSLTGENLNEFIYLQRMYDAGAGACFDILSAQGYGLFSGPTDRRMRPFQVNVARHEYLRDIMVANGDAHKPIWISEAAWNAVAEPGVPRDIVGYGNYGEVTNEQAARYMPLMYARAQQEWPWVGVINYWFFTRPDDSETGQAFFYFRMVEPDYQPERPTFTPLPVYTAMKDYITTQQPQLYQGVHQAEHWTIVRPESAALVDASGATFGQALRTPDARFTVHGTDIILRWQGDAPPDVRINGQAAAPDSTRTSAGWNESYFRLSSLLAASFEVSAAVPGLLDSVTVLDRTRENLTPPLAVLGIALGMALWALLGAWRERRR